MGKKSFHYCLSKYMSIARHQNTLKWTIVANQLQSRGTAMSEPHQFIYSNIQTATARISGLSRMPRGLLPLLPSSRDSMVALVAREGVSVVPERSEDTEFVAVAVVVSETGRSWRCGGW